MEGKFIIHYKDGKTISESESDNWLSVPKENISSLQIRLDSGQIHTLSVTENNYGIFQHKCAAHTLGLSCKLCDRNDIEICKKCRLFYRFEIKKIESDNSKKKELNKLNTLPILYNEFENKTYGIEVGFIQNKKGDCLIMYVNLKDGSVKTYIDNIFDMKLNLNLHKIKIKRGGIDQNG